MMAIAERADVEEAGDTRERVTVWDTGEVLYVHPVASLFPMMSDEELDDLAEDIRQHGLIHPIVLDQHRQLTDGRNRLEGCRRAKVAPDFTIAPLDDPVAFILSANVVRRQMDKGQIAMAVAEANFLSGKKFRFGDGQVLAGQLGVSGARLSQAMTVIQYAPELSADVLSGTSPLNEAYASAVESKRARKTAAEEARQHEAGLLRLRAADPDLADQVEDHRLDLKAALEALDRRQERDRQKRDAALELLARGVRVFETNGEAPQARAAGLAAGLEVMRLPDGSAMAVLPDGSRLTEERLRGCVEVARALYARLYEGNADGEEE